MATPSTADIRPYLTSAYSDEEITALCADYFRDVSDNFATGMTKGQKIHLLLDHCQRREAILNLLEALQDDRPEQYRKRFRAVVVEIESPIHLELVRVPAGEFLMGSDSTKDKDADDDEKPQHRVHVPEFYIGKYPVTVAQFDAFVQADGYKTAAEKAGYGWVWTDSKWQQVKGANWRHPSGPQDDVGQKADHPVTPVSWHDAVAFCRWLSRGTGRPIRLPTEAEWEKAARGTDGRIYPWGNQAPDKTLCNFDRNVDDTTSVGRYPAGVSPCGALDMSGNVWEWTLSLYRPYPYQPDDGRNAVDVNGMRVVRGGSDFSDAGTVRCAVRGGLDPDDFEWYDGFRVVASPLHS